MQGETAATIVVVAIAVGGVILSWRRIAVQERRRPAEWAALGDELGLAYYPKDPFELPRKCSHAFFRLGSSQQARNMLHGTHRGRTLACFDYRYQQGKQGLGWMCALIQSPIVFTPLIIHPRTMVRLDDGLYGNRDLQLGAVEFDGAFVVRCPDAEFARSIAHPQMRDLLLARKGVAIEAADQSVLVYYSIDLSGLLDVSSGARELIELGCDFMDLLPDYLVADRGARLPEAQEPAEAPPN